MNPSDLDRAKIATERAIGLRGTLHDLVKMAWHIVEPGSEFKDNWHIGAICEHLDAVRTLQIRSLVINVPPGCMKSLTTEVFWPVEAWIKDPGLRFISASFDASLTLRDANKSLAIMRSDWFKERWGDRVILPSDVAGADYANTAGGWRFSTSIEGKMTGRHGDIAVVDDPHKPQAISKNTLDAATRWWRETLPTRFRDHKTSRRVVIMQRLHEDDITGQAMRDGGYEILRLPMRYEPKAVSYTKIGGDIRSEDGELLWPDRIGPDEVAALEKDLGGRGFAAQLQQRPSPASGAIFKREWFRQWVEPLHPPPQGVAWIAKPSRFDQVIQSWDCTFKDTDGSDFVVGQVWGRKGPDFFLLDQIRERMNFSATLEAIRLMTRRWPQAITKLIEDKANGSAVISVLRKEISGIVEIEPEGGKEARANAVSPLFEAGNVWDPDPALYSWVDQMREERIGFPVASHDDTVDATTQALTWLYKRKSNLAAAMKKLAEMQQAGKRIL